MAPATLARTDRALEKIGDFVALQDYAALKAVGRTFFRQAGAVVGFRQSIPRRYAKNGKRRLAAVDLTARFLGTAASPTSCARWWKTRRKASEGRRRDGSLALRRAATKKQG